MNNECINIRSVLYLILSYLMVLSLLFLYYCLVKSYIPLYNIFFLFYKNHTINNYFNKLSLFLDKNQKYNYIYGLIFSKFIYVYIND